MLCQDVTITLILDDMDRQTYQDKIKTLSEMDSNGDLNTMTYDPERSWAANQELTEEQQAKMDSLL